VNCEEEEDYFSTPRACWTKLTVKKIISAPHIWLIPAS
jgi:hypothetical protein